MKRAIILDYMFGCVDIVSIPTNLAEYNESTEQYLENIGYKMSQIDWMVSDNDDIPVYYDNDECPTYRL